MSEALFGHPVPLEFRAIKRATAWNILYVAGGENELNNLTFTKKEIKTELKSTKNVALDPYNLRLSFLHQAPQTILKKALTIFNPIWMC